MQAQVQAQALVWESLKSAPVWVRIGVVEVEAKEQLPQSQSPQRVAGRMGSTRNTLDMVEDMACSDHFQLSFDTSFDVTCILKG